MSSFVFLALLFIYTGAYLGYSEEVVRDTSQQDCPDPCTQGGHRYCFPLPCPLPPCADPVKDKGACCSHCPNGPTCLIKGQIVPEGHNTTTNGQWCTCRKGGDSHNGLVICSRCFDILGRGLSKRCA